LVPVRGRRRVTEAVLVSRAGGGEAVGVGVGDTVGEAPAVAAMGAAGDPDEQPTAASVTATAAPVAAINFWA
jgi:hypothetical protein